MFKEELDLGLLFEERLFEKESYKIKSQYGYLATNRKEEYQFNEPNIRSLTSFYNFNNVHSCNADDALQAKLHELKLNAAINCGSPTVVALFVHLLRKGFFFNLSTNIDRSGEILTAIDKETYDLVNIGYSTLIPISRSLEKHPFKVYFYANKTKCSFYSFQKSLPNSARIALNAKQFSNSKSAFTYSLEGWNDLKYEFDDRTGNHFMDLLLLNEKEINDILIFDNAILTQLFPILKTNTNRNRIFRLDKSILPLKVTQAIDNFAYGNAVLINNHRYRSDSKFFEQLLGLFKRSYCELKDSDFARREVARIMLCGTQYLPSIVENTNGIMKTCLEYLLKQVCPNTQANLLTKYTPFLPV